MRLLEIAKSYQGNQETAGANRGPLVDKWKGMVSKGLTAAPIPWCGCFVFAMLCETNGMDRKKLAAALGYDFKTWFPEGTDSWLQQARATKTLTLEPSVGDLFLLMRPLKKVYSTTDAYHIGIVAGPVTKGSPFMTIEGNTVPGTVEGALSREGTSVAVRTRNAKPGAVVFIKIPEALKGLG